METFRNSSVQQQPLGPGNLGAAATKAKTRKRKTAGGEGGDREPKKRKGQGERTAVEKPAKDKKPAEGKQKEPTNYPAIAVQALPDYAEDLQHEAAEAIAVQALPDYAEDLQHEAAEAIAARLDVIQFMNSSVNAPVGDGAGEHHGTDAALNDRSRYAEFMSLGGRRVLSNFAIVDGGVRIMQKDRDGQLREAVYSSVELGFHAGKALLMREYDIALKYEKGGEVDKMSPGEAKKAGGKNGLLKMDKAALAQWDGLASEVRMGQLLRARLEQEPLFKQVLIASGRALLVHQTRGVQDVRLTRILHQLRHEARGEA